MRDWTKIVLLSLGCIACGASIVHQVRTMPQSAWDCIVAGRWDIGPLETPIEPMRLTDRTTDHKSCGADCRLKGVGR